jgi:hypothetical protein
VPVDVEGTDRLHMREAVSLNGSGGPSPCQSTVGTNPARRNNRRMPLLLS